MIKLKVEEVGSGLHPTEIVVAIRTVDGLQNMVVDKRSLSNGAIKIGYPIRQDGGKFLVELPRESVNGSWRVWVEASELKDDGRKDAA